MHAAKKASTPRTLKSPRTYKRTYKPTSRVPHICIYVCSTSTTESQIAVHFTLRPAVFELQSVEYTCTERHQNDLWTVWGHRCAILSFSITIILSYYRFSKKQKRKCINPIHQNDIEHYKANGMPISQLSPRFVLRLAICKIFAFLSYSYWNNFNFKFIFLKLKFGISKFQEVTFARTVTRTIQKKFSNNHGCRCNGALIILSLMVPNHRFQFQGIQYFCDSQNFKYLKEVTFVKVYMCRIP